jgi:hypothetical protein
MRGFSARTPYWWRKTTDWLKTYNERLLCQDAL